MDGIVETLTARAKAALAHWNLPAQVPQLLKYRENAVFKVRLADGRPAALRLHRPAYHSQAALASELAWMADLRGQGLAVPEPIPAVTGALLVALPAEGDVPHYADLIGWVEGEPLGETGVPLPREGRDLPAIFAAIGRDMARMQRGLQRRGGAGGLVGGFCGFGSHGGPFQNRARAPDGCPERAPSVSGPERFPRRPRSRTSYTRRWAGSLPPLSRAPNPQAVLLPERFRGGCAFGAGPDGSGPVSPAGICGFGHRYRRRRPSQSGRRLHSRQSCLRMQLRRPGRSRPGGFRCASAGDDAPEPRPRHGPG